MNKILMVGNTDFSIYIYRKELVKRLIDEGYEVYISAPKGNYVTDLETIGCKFINTNLSTHGLNPIKEIAVLIQYFFIIQKIKPTTVLTYTIKPNVYAGFICRITRTPYIVNITGLGTSIENGGFLQKIALSLLKIGTKKANKIFFQNKENLEFIIENGIGIGKQRLIPGSGVNLVEHKYEKYPKENIPLQFLFIGRIIKSKGVEELFELISYLEKNHEKNFHFHICGAMGRQYIERFYEIIKSDSISYYGKVKNIHPYISQSHLIILPSHHEGMANVLLEAAATGRPVIASNIPGCIETFDENITGISFTVKNSESLIKAVEKFISLSHEEKKIMGINGRKKVEREFNREIITNAYIEEIQNIN